jgi:2'-5' RNA ligase
VENNLSQGKSRYFIAIVPPPLISQEVDKLKDYFKAHYQSRAALNSPPHITLRIPFLWKEANEGVLISSLNEFAGKQRPFTVSLLNFSSFAPRVIFININEKESLIQLHRDLRQFCETKLSLVDTSPKDIPFHPHLTLAFRDLRKQMFLLAWEEFSKRTFSASFKVDKITLLKHNGKIWEGYKNFLF